MNKEKNNEWLATLLHFSDSVLPIGAYAHSFGLEGLCQLGAVQDAAGLKVFLERDVMASLLHVDLPIFALAHAAVLAGDFSELTALDELSRALRPTRQLREAARTIGRQQWRLFMKTWELTTQMSFTATQSPVVLGTIFALQGVPVMAGLNSVAYQTFSALVQASLKLLPLGPSATQDILVNSMRKITLRLPGICELKADELGTFNPLWDIGASRHERARARLFLS